MKINYNLVHFEFHWSWIKDKTLTHIGDSEQGVLIIGDEDGEPIKIYAYELISNEEDNKEE